MVTEFNEIARNEAVRLRLDETEKRKFFNRLCKDNIAMVIHNLAKKKRRNEIIILQTY